MTLKEEFQTRNFNNLLRLSFAPTANLGANRASALFILFIEVPFLLRICPTSGKFDAFVRKISTNYLRAAAYGIMSAIQFISLTVTTSTLIVLAVFLLLTGLCYLLAAIRGQAFIGSKTLGGAGVAQMII
ncbi:Golgi apparatus membrane protein TVP18 [Beauveria bassiana]|uniref:Golgi apparatus membrane protein TVP18 n=1 Tax=Beauveria bassiana TaxID=176275 RepID=A0A2N6NJE5_BEABA|nr:Golgi apparatus membrane protein TVP18 [Beauveria bassiana]